MPQRGQWLGFALTSPTLSAAHIVAFALESTPRNAMIPAKQLGRVGLIVDLLVP
jgi:hypothetical protein